MNQGIVKIVRLLTVGAGLSLIVCLNGCQPRAEEKASADQPATSPAPLPSETQLATPTISPRSTRTDPTPAPEKPAAKKSESLVPNLQRQQSARSTPAPTQSPTYGVGSGSGSEVGPLNVGGSDINRPNPVRGDSGNIDYSRVFNSRDVDQKVRILEKPQPRYTEAARQNQINGTVLLSVVFTASGQVTDIRVVKPLPDGLNERAIEAAKQIKFTPAMKGGRAVSMRILVEYNFNLY